LLTGVHVIACKSKLDDSQLFITKPRHRFDGGVVYW